MRSQDDGDNVIRMPGQVVREIVEHALKEAPIEACGLIAGRGPCASRYYRMTNADASPEHFSMLPKEQFAAVKDMRNQGIELLAICHSHPASPARLSDEDLRLALTPGVVHIVVSLQEPSNPQIKGFRVREGFVIEQSVKVLDDE